MKFISKVFHVTVAAILINPVHSNFQQFTHEGPGQTYGYDDSYDFGNHIKYTSLGGDDNGDCIDTDGNAHLCQVSPRVCCDTVNSKALGKCCKSDDDDRKKNDCL